jgi:beta-phosphoglucomutase
MKYKAIIFDLDGTIIDTEHIWHHASKQLLENKGVKLDPEIENQLLIDIRGLALHKSCLAIKNAAQLPDNLDDLIREKSSIAHNLYKQQVRFMPGFIQFFESLSIYNLKTSIATNASAQTAELTDQLLGLRRFFGQHIYNVSHVNNLNKPDPALYLHAAKQLEIEPSECIAIEDSAHGITAAKRSGMFCIGLNFAKNKSYLTHADLIVDSYSEIDLPTILQITPTRRDKQLLSEAK